MRALVLVAALAVAALAQAQMPAMSSHGGSAGLPLPAAPAGAAAPTAGAPGGLGAQVVRIFASRCTSCHGGPAPLGGLALDGGRVRAQLIDVPSLECASARRVVPGKPDASYLMMKLTGTGACFVGARMPMGGDIPPAEVAVVRSWIAAGAPAD